MEFHGRFAEIFAAVDGETKITESNADVTRNISADRLRQDLAPVTMTEFNNLD